MPDIAALRVLLDRCRVAKGPHPELDYDILAATVFPEGGDIWDVPSSLRVPFHGGAEPVRLTDSLDAVRALIEHVLPGWGWKVEWQEARNGRSAAVWPPDQRRGQPGIPHLSGAGPRSPCSQLSSSPLSLLRIALWKCGSKVDDGQAYAQHHAIRF